MAKAENTEVDEIEVIDAEVDEEEGQDGETPPAEESEEDQGEDDETVVVTIGDEAPPEDEEEGDDKKPGLVNELRRLVREKEKENRALRKATVETVEAKSQDALKKPTLADCDYDEEEYEQKLDAYKAQQAKATAEASAREAAQQAADSAWQERVGAYEKAKTELKVSDYVDAEEAAESQFSVTQRGIIISGCDNAALVTYALHKHPAKAKELAAIADPVKFSFAIAKLETQLKTAPKKVLPAPERRIGGSTSGTVGGSEGNLDKLRAEAEKTGDHSKVLAYRRDLKKKAAAK